MTTQTHSTYSTRRYRSLAGPMGIALAVSLSVAMSGYASARDGAHHQASTTPQYSAPINMFGGVSYQGEPALAVTAALVQAGGGSENFSFAKALVSMLGEETVNAEVAKLTQQYGEAEVNTH